MRQCTALRASDIYQGGENEPTQLTELYWPADKQWTPSSEKATLLVVQLDVLAQQIAFWIWQYSKNLPLDSVCQLYDQAANNRDYSG